jgi:hypothetical protein
VAVKVSPTALLVDVGSTPIVLDADVALRSDGPTRDIKAVSRSMPAERAKNLARVRRNLASRSKLNTLPGD